MSDGAREYVAGTGVELGMRISQWKTVAWTSNALLVGLAALAGIRFADVREARAERADASWPNAATAADEGAVEHTARGRHGSELADLLERVPVNGRRPVPPPPPPPPGPEDAVRDFVADHAYGGLIHSSTDPYDAIAYVHGSDGTAYDLRPGEAIGDFVLLGFQEDAEGGRRSLVFSTRGNERLARLTSPTVSPEGFARPTGPVRVVPYTELASPVVVRDSIAVNAFQALHEDPSGLTWFVPRDALAWWARYGTQDVVEHVRTESVEGPLRGVRLLSEPGADSPVAERLGLRKGDVVRHVDGARVATARNVFRHLVDPAGHGRRHVLDVVSADGVERAIVHHLAR